MAGDGERYPAAAVGHSTSNEIIHKCIWFCVPSTHVCHKVFHACLRFIQAHISYLSPGLIICIQGTCGREPSVSRTFENNTINNTQHGWQTLIADPNKAACVFGRVWHWVAGGGSLSLCSNRRICPISFAVKDFSSDKRIHNNIIVCFLVWGCQFGLWGVPYYIYSSVSYRVILVHLHFRNSTYCFINTSLS